METILIIEDDSSMLRGLKDNFEYAGYNVLTAADGEAGLNANTLDIGQRCDNPSCRPKKAFPPFELNMQSFICNF